MYDFTVGPSYPRFHNQGFNQLWIYPAMDSTICGSCSTVVHINWKKKKKLYISGPVQFKLVHWSTVLQNISSLGHKAERF